MILVDTSVWISHLRDGIDDLAILLNKGVVACHPYILGELACGNIKNRKEIVKLLESLPFSLIASHQEVLDFISHKDLMGKGLGYIDMHLLVSSILSETPLWTLDKRLQIEAVELDTAFISKD
jgi:predicted nucleic acid-binding protein